MPPATDAGAPRIAGTPKSSSQSEHATGGSGFCLNPATCSTFRRNGASPNCVRMPIEAMKNEPPPFK
jgi:hypothetical protein